ncbi:Oligosaccharide 4-alpha-D-glucosyltransferase [Kordia antarctica]|uniref:Oligosaccharide 4-alpha-D-glucosyltransferase n=1 Tax=Kordia antarctica TaxID=1218801 RepID=A0A7L4ZPG6_9FLAO|nr:TIM-barrel domain-containing protein [Kordia antarctica]QHI37784.1 Oligosaccharide 4-alpha-D-glucosyltransferase [Kordia antarctica]
MGIKSLYAMKIFKLLIVSLLFSQFSVAQNATRVFQGFSYDEESASIMIQVTEGIYTLKAYNTEIIETTFVPKNQDENKDSHAVVMQPTIPTTTYSKDATTIRFSTAGISATITKSPFQISYSYKGKPIISEKNGYQKIENGEAIQFNLTKDEILYGGGARALGMNRRGNRLKLYNRAHYGYETRSELMNFTLPIVLSSNMYMIHFDNAPIGFLDLDSKKDNTLTYETISGRKTYQVIAGDSWIDVIDNYTDLTGKQPLPPRWAFGNFASRFGYHSQAETEATIKAFKDEKIPVDAVILDLYWFGKDIKGTMGNLEIYKDSFPDAKQMIKDFNDQGVKTIFITEPFVLTTSNRWYEASNLGVLAKDSVGNPFKYDFYFGNTGLIDIYNPKGEKWFWSIYKDLADLGVAGVWGDLGEPEVHPEKLLHHTGTANEKHNIYGHDWARLVKEGYDRDFPETRPFILMRAGYSGSQRYGLIPWSGDVNRTWGGLQSQPEIALQMAMQGLGYMHSDLGGFAGANLDDKLYVRWLQYGVFQPIYRPHAQEEVPSEPVFRSARAKKLAKQAIELRYKLLPYNYTIAFENNQKGTPLMRPLFFEETDTKALYTNASTYLWGNDFLVTPIVKDSVQTKEVYFPKDAVWFDFYTDEKVLGGQTKMVATQENLIPVYVRGGAFIPMAKPMQTTANYDQNTFDLHYYHDERIHESERKLYNDNGLLSNAYEKGNYELLEFESEFEKSKLEIELEAETGINYSTSNKKIDVFVHNINKKPRKVKFRGKRVKFDWNKHTKTLSFSIKWNTKKKEKLIIKL